ncbi:hypothetical protein A6C57_26760 (plasmid) [Fibrella sp. ES10-3-2-2]
MNERKSALDHLLEGNVFTREQTKMAAWDEYYLGIESIKVVFYEEGKGVYGHARTLHNSQVTPVLRCSNKLCSNGGYEIKDVIFDMIREKKTHKELSIECVGEETSAKGKRVYGNCENGANFVIEITFKEEAPKAN